MALLLLGGTLLLAAWVAWSLYIAERQRAVTVSLLVQVQRGAADLDPFLRLLCRLFQQSLQIRLQEIWVLALDESEDAHRIVQRLHRTYPLFRFRSSVSVGQVDFSQPDGQLLLVLDLVHRLTPLAALQAVSQLLAAGPPPPGTAALTFGE